eukprot:CAMPEP_0169196750 /NCGR_PEP_ID=MMETSP1016-20121227/7898_1 /TAXON_ID=342587 /ORGANISM="Karlodinium micrum, Strain CCMP2283" /LENGTH=55 /DNA_ID=CAMNT_0009273345 /DNA_START=205 /DNA_END=372 /DNA_ORIENTATION=-
MASVRLPPMSAPGIICNAAVRIGVLGHNALNATPSFLNSSAMPNTHIDIPYFAIV